MQLRRNLGGPNEGKFSRRGSQAGFFTPGETKWRLRNVANSASPPPPPPACTGLLKLLFTGSFGASNGDVEPVSLHFILFHNKDMSVFYFKYTACLNVYSIQCTCKCNTAFRVNKLF